MQNAGKSILHLYQESLVQVMGSPSLISFHSSFLLFMASLFIQLLWFVPLPFFISAQNATLGSSLSTLDDNPYWKSPSNEFAFGFQPVQGRGDHFLLAIWFDKIPEKTIVWTANGGTPVQRGSKVELTSAGRLSLSSPNVSENWILSPIGGGKAESAAMLDTGNFVLTGNNSNVLWQSFENPTDTILPTQILYLGAEVRSRLTKDDYTPGRFLFYLQPDQNLCLYPLPRLTRLTIHRYRAYWASDVWNKSSQLIFNRSGYIFLILRDGSQVLLTKGIPLSTSNYYQRATLDFDGVLRQYAYQKSSSSSQLWSTQWSLPQDICSVDFGDEGSGVCGFNSYCKLEDGRPTCHCPPGYVYRYPEDSFGGCKWNFTPQTCDTDRLRVGVGYEMQKIPNTYWNSSHYERYNNVEEDWCSNTCLNDCLCAVSSFREGDCRLKKHPVSNGKSNPSIVATAFVKVGNTTSEFPLPGPNNGVDKKDKDKDKWFLPGSILLGTSGFLNLVCLLLVPLFIYFSYHKKQFKPMPDTSTFGVNLRSFTYNELEEATDGFKEELGQGSFSTVYKGRLHNGTFVAVKRLDKLVRGIEKEFKTEVNAIGLTNHKNLVKLLGYCDEGSNRLLVYEYMSNGSLADFLFGSSRQEWSKRVQIAFGIARGLVYLHEDCSTQIIHCDVKPQNILLDDFFMAKISDFGLAKLLNTNQTRTETGIRGTRGYVAPEWWLLKNKNMAIVTAKVDVYSFGIMLLEIICCRKNAEAEEGAEEIDILSERVHEYFVERDFHLLVANDEEAKNDGNSLERFLMVALWCIQEDPSLRPTMKKVTQMLEGAVEVSMPPEPSSFLS